MVYYYIEYIIPAPVPSSLSAVVAVSVVAMVTMITTTIVITLSCCLVKKYKTTSKSTNTSIWNLLLLCMFLYRSS